MSECLCPSGGVALPIYDGVVTFDDGEVPVILGLDDHTIRLSSGGNEIGEWGEGEYRITDLGDGSYHITAENETLRFVPHQPNLLAAELGDGLVKTIPPESLPTEPSQDEVTEDGLVDVPVVGTGESEAPPPRPITRAAFYTLAGTTSALGLWALIQMIIG